MERALALWYISFGFDVNTAAAIPQVSVRRGAENHPELAKESGDRS